jgi:hypothetical protein
MKLKLLVKELQNSNDKHLEKELLLLRLDL